MHSFGYILYIMILKIIKNMFWLIVVPIVVVVVIFFVWYYLQPMKISTFSGVVTSRVIEPAKVEKSFNMSTSFYARSSGLSTVEKTLWPGQRYNVVLENNEVMTIIYDRSMDPFRVPTAEVGDTVKITNRTKWLPFFGTFLMSQKFEKIQ